MTTEQNPELASNCLACNILGTDTEDGLILAQGLNGYLCWNDFEEFVEASSLDDFTPESWLEYMRNEIVVPEVEPAGIVPDAPSVTE